MKQQNPLYHPIGANMQIRGGFNDKFPKTRRFLLTSHLSEKQLIFLFFELILYSHAQNLMQESHFIGQGKAKGDDLQLSREEKKFEINWTKAETKRRCRKMSC